MLHIFQGASDITLKFSLEERKWFKFLFKLSGLNKKQAGETTKLWKLNYIFFIGTSFITVFWRLLNKCHLTPGKWSEMSSALLVLRLIGAWTTAHQGKTEKVIRASDRRSTACLKSGPSSDAKHSLSYDEVLIQGCKSSFDCRATGDDLNLVLISSMQWDREPRLLIC